MEPFVTAALALGTVIGTKALEKTGEKMGEIFVEKTQRFLTSLNQESPTTVTAIEHTPDQPLDYSKAILAIQDAAKKRPELWSDIQELAELGQNEPKLIPYIQNVKQQWESQKSLVARMRDNYGVIAETIGKNVNINTVQGDANF